MTKTLGQDGFAIFDKETDVLRWAKAACKVAQNVLQGEGERRHGGTWFVGVDALPNADDGSIAGVPLGGTWRDHVELPDRWHRAQLSVIFPGYPKQDQGESDSAHRYRINRDAAHVDGLLPDGPERRRHLREPHWFIAGLPLNTVQASPLVVWPGSHRIMRAAFARGFAACPPGQRGDIDITDIYQAARKEVFTRCPRVPIHAEPGQVILLHRHLVHGVAPWGDAAGGEPRMIAYFRPQIRVEAWL